MIKQVLTIIGLAGSAIYLFIFGVTMSFGAFTWTPDFLATHGEPYMVIAFAAVSAYAALQEYRQLSTTIKLDINVDSPPLSNQADLPQGSELCVSKKTLYGPRRDRDPAHA